jgi:hypothetical protein
MKIKIPSITYEEAITNKNLSKINTEKIIIKVIRILIWIYN